MSPTSVLYRLFVMKELTSIACSMVLASVYCLMLGHPGLVFKHGDKRLPSSDNNAGSAEQRGQDAFEMGS